MTARAILVESLIAKINKWRADAEYGDASPSDMEREAYVLLIEARDVMRRALAEATSPPSAPLVESLTALSQQWRKDAEMHYARAETLVGNDSGRVFARAVAFENCTDALDQALADAARLDRPVGDNTAVVDIAVAPARTDGLVSVSRVPPPPGCNETVSSRICERGTLGCTIEHDVVRALASPLPSPEKKEEDTR